MRGLNTKLRRDLTRLWGQALAIAAVAALGSMLFTLSLGTIASLETTRDAYYERYRFAQLFATLKRAPESLARELAAIPNVRWVRTRIARNLVLDVPGMDEPVNALATTLADGAEVHLRSGRLAAAGSEHEAVLAAPFAEAHGLGVGDRVDATINGSRRRLTVVGIALSPEYVFYGVPGAMVPDDERFGVLWMDRGALAAAFDLEGAFNQVVLGLTQGANETAVIARVDALLAPYGGIGAYGRRNQVSHATLTGEIEQLKASVRIAAPVYLGLVAFMLHTLMLRHVQTERERIGVLKALGYTDTEIALHYLALVAMIVGAGVVLGMLLGTAAGAEVTRRYAEHYRFPFLNYGIGAGNLMLVVLVQLPAAIVGAAASVRQAVRLQPAEAMRAPPPPVYRRTFLERLAARAALDQPTRMILRHILRWPLRSATTVLGIAAAMAILIAPLGVLDSAAFMIDTHFFRAERQDMTLAFAEVRPYRAVHAMRRFPGVLRAEPFRATTAEISAGARTWRVTVLGRDGLPELARPLDHRLRALAIPRTGILIAQTMAERLGVGRGDHIELRLLETDRAPLQVPVTAIADAYVGLTFFTAFMDRRQLNHLLGEGDLVSGMQLALDEARLPELYRAVKDTPAISGAISQRAALASMRRMLEQNLQIALVNLLVAAMLVLGLVYNNARISLSERLTELAGMRLLGYSRLDAAYVLAGEVWLLALLALPLGALLGWGAAFAMTEGTANELFRLPLHIQARSFAVAVLVIAAAVLASIVVVTRPLYRADIVSLLQSRG